jgi:hypothetical protein
MILSREYLWQHYVVSRKSTRQIEKETGYDHKTIARWLTSCDIPLRSAAESNTKFEFDKNLLYDLYIIQRKTLLQIADFLMCSEPTIRRKLVAYDIPIRSSGEALKGKKLSDEKRKCISISLIGNKRSLGYRHTEYAKNRIGQSGLGRKKSPEACKKISQRLKGRIGTRLGAKLTEETKKKIGDSHRGDKCYLWKGGKSFGPYCPKFNNGFKEHIRNKFDRKCYLCPTTEYQNRIKLSVHHIDYNKNSICNGKEWAFVPLCSKCHARSNNNRHYYFNLLINYWAMNSDINFCAGLSEWSIIQFQIRI